MRDPNRIEEYINVIETIWKENPDLRFSQLVLNIFRNNSDYYLEDDITLKMFVDTYVNNGPVRGM